MQQAKTTESNKLHVLKIKASYTFFYVQNLKSDINKKVQSFYFVEDAKHP